MYICPVCKKALELKNNSFVCENNHCFDIARQGYVNLLTTVGHNPKNAGDNKNMVTARTKFLEKDYYKPLALKLSEIIGGSHTVIDSGCGEGYYTTLCAKNNPDTQFFGIDIAKSAISHAGSVSRSIPNVKFAVASSFELPFPSEFADTVVSVFAPVTNNEYSRVLKSNGSLIVVSPNPKHLFELKSVLYEKPYINKSNNYDLPDFSLSESCYVTFTADIQNNEDIFNLFLMTPYCYKTSASATEKLRNIPSLSITCDFSVQIFKKNF